MKVNSNYDIIATDYENYSLVYSCQKFAYLFKIEYAWFFSRDKNLDEKKVEEIEKKFNKNILNNMINIKQICNN